GGAIVHRVGLICMLAPEAVPDFADLVRAMERQVALYPQLSRYRHVLGGILCRAGRWKEGIAQLEKALQAPVHRDDGSKPAHWLFLAMAHHHLGHVKEARTWLDRAVRGIDQASMAEALPWAQRVELQLLGREAKTLRHAMQP